VEPSVPVEPADEEEEVEGEQPSPAAPDPFIEKAIEVLKGEVKKAA
jgi:hypothetical protein